MPFYLREISVRTVGPVEGPEGPFLGCFMLIILGLLCFGGYWVMSDPERIKIAVDVGIGLVTVVTLIGVIANR